MLRVISIRREFHCDSHQPIVVLQGHTVLKALEASGLDAKSASGYRGYYESKKQENPNWPGVPMRPDQDFIIVVGPKPAA